MRRTSPWAKTPAAMVEEYAIASLPAEIYKVVSMAITLAGTARSTDTGLPPEGLAWRTVTGNIDHVNAAIDGGYLIVNDQGFVTLGRFDELESRRETTASNASRGLSMTPEAIRTRECRARAKARATLQADGVTPLPAPVTHHVTVGVMLPLSEELESEREKNHHQISPVTVADPVVVEDNSFLEEEDASKDIASASDPMPVAGSPKAGATTGATSPKVILVFPDAITEAEKRAILRTVDGLALNVAQTILDELAGTLEAGRPITSPSAWVKVLATKAKEGLFKPVLGVAVANRRNGVAPARFYRPDPVTRPNFGAVSEGLKAAIPLFKDPGVAEIMARIQTKAAVLAETEISQNVAPA